MSMYIEIETRTIYTVNLTDKDMIKVKSWIREHEDDLPSSKMEDNIAWAVARLYEEDEISLYNNEKATESGFYNKENKIMSMRTENEARWSEFEERAPKEILESIE